jgi:hypothetical protein
VFLLAAFFVLAWTAQLGKCAAFDEPLHFVGAWIQTHYDDFRCNPEDPPLWKFYVAVGTRKDDLKIDFQSSLWNRMLNSIPAPAVHYVLQTMYQTPGNRADELLRHGRARMLLLAVALGALIGWWAWRLGGPLAATVAVAAFSFDPNFLAHSPLIKNDVTITLVFLGLMACVWLLGERATFARCIGVALIIGVALTVKFSGVLALPMLAIALLCRVFIVKPWPFLKWTLNTRLQRFAAAFAIVAASVVVGGVFIWACYGFRFGPSADPNAKFDYYNPILDCAENEMILRQDPVPAYPSSSELQEWVNRWRPSAVVRLVKSADKKRLLPEAWLFGFLYTYGTSLARRTYLCGQIGVAGWWYYFPLAMAVKTPLATLAGIAAAGALWLLGAGRSSWRRNPWTSCAMLVGPVFYMVVAMRSHLDIGLRHIFPVYPYLFIFLGVMAAQTFRRRPKTTGWVVSLLFLGLIVETAAAFPDYLPFFNVAAGGSSGGLALLSDSNIDWGQDLPALAQWQRDHPDRQIYLCRFGLPDPRYYGLHYFEMDGSLVSIPDQTTPSGLPPVYAISAVAMQGPYMTQEQLQFYQRFQREKPLAILHGTIYLFDSSPVPRSP